jgi:hypothetical protein
VIIAANARLRIPPKRQMPVSKVGEKAFTEGKPLPLFMRAGADSKASPPLNCPPSSDKLGALAVDYVMRHNTLGSIAAVYDESGTLHNVSVVISGVIGNDQNTVELLDVVQWSAG